mgnify:CR=1 FL=1
MPVVSQAQSRAMHAAEEGHSTLGIPQSVGADFVAASHGMKVSALPKRIGKPHKPKKAPMFGSLVPHSSEHYMSTPTPIGPDEEGGM